MRRTCARKKRLMMLMYVRIAVFWRNRFIGAQGARLWPVIVTVYSHLIECVIESYCGMQRQFWPAQNFVASALPANCGQMACTAYQSTTLALEPILPMPIVSYHAARQNDTGKDQTRSKNTSKQAAKTQKKTWHIVLQQHHSSYWSWSSHLSLWDEIVSTTTRMTHGCDVPHNKWTLTPWPINGPTDKMTKSQKYDSPSLEVLNLLEFSTFVAVEEVEATKPQSMVTVIFSSNHWPHRNPNNPMTVDRTQWAVWSVRWWPVPHQCNGNAWFHDFHMNCVNLSNDFQPKTQCVVGLIAPFIHQRHWSLSWGSFHILHDIHNHV